MDVEKKKNLNLIKIKFEYIKKNTCKYIKL